MDLLSHRHDAVCQIQVVLLQDPVGHHQVVNVSEHEGAPFAVLALGLEECGGVIAPVTAWVEVVRGVPPIVEAVAVALGAD